MRQGALHIRHLSHLEGVVGPIFWRDRSSREHNSPVYFSQREVQMRFKLNGDNVDLPKAMRDDRLLWVLRDYFALNGPKYGCGVGACGACVVHVDGEAVRSCLLTGANIVGRSVVTLEGLGAGHADRLHPVQRAWIEASVPQCGYCQNGQVMTAAALLNVRPDASSVDIETAMDEVICRCGTHQRIKAAIALAQRTMK